jgi:two-component system phosphate regulon sensor histidine kinase PhoR
MPRSFPTHRLLDCLLVALTAGTACAMFFDLSLPIADATVQIARMGISVGVALAAISLIATRTHRKQKLARRYLERLLREDYVELGDSATGAPPHALQRDGFWRGIIDQMSEFATSGRNRVREAEHARAKAEVRGHRLATQLDQISEIVSCLNEPIVAVDHYDEVAVTNTSAAELFHLERDGRERQLLHDVLECRELVQLLTETRNRRQPTQRTCEMSVQVGESEQRWFNVEARTIPSDGGEAHGAVAILRDISDSKETQKRHAEFVSAVSHEMKTPLAGIKAYVELLADGDAEDEETREEFLEVINGQADRLKRLIDNLLNIARIEAGVVQVNKTPQPLNPILEEAFNVVQPAAERKQIELVSDLSPMYLGGLLDRDMALQSAINLLSNAIKYTPDKGKVTLRSRLQGNEIVFEVADTGVGLSEEDCERVFDKFYRVRSNKNMAPGTGLGLPLAQHIVQDVHGGSLVVESKLGEGSTFRVTIPSVEQMK